jgi:hypothetical protein
MIYTHVVKDMRNPVASPFDLLPSAKTNDEKFTGAAKRND